MDNQELNNSRDLWASPARSISVLPVNAAIDLEHPELTASEEKVFQQENSIHQSASVPEGQVCLLGCEEGVIPIISVPEKPAPEPWVKLVKVSNRIYRFSARPTRFLLKLESEGKTIRQIHFNVEKKRIIVPYEDCDKGAVNMVILVPQTLPWLIDFIKTVLHKQNFFMVASSRNHFIYHRQLTMSWSVAVFVYGNPDSISSMMNTVKFVGSDLLLLLEGEDLSSIFDKIFKIVGNFGDLLTFKKNDAKFALSYDALQPKSAKPVVDHLKAIVPADISGAKIRTSGITNDKDRSDLEKLLVEFLVLPTSFKAKTIFLLLEFASHVLLNEDIVRQFTIEIMPTPCNFHDIKTVGSRFRVYISCSVYSVWILQTTLEEDSKKYPSLLAVREVFTTDEPNPPAPNFDKLTDTLTNKFHWQKPAVTGIVVNDAPSSPTSGGKSLGPKDPDSPTDKNSNHGSLAKSDNLNDSGSAMLLS